MITRFKKKKLGKAKFENLFKFNNLKFFLKTKNIKDIKKSDF